MTGNLCIYPNKLKNWDFADAEHARFDPEKTGPLLPIGAVFSGSKIACSAKVKTNSSACLGIYTILSFQPGIILIQTWVVT